MRTDRKNTRFQPIAVDLFCGAGGMSLGFEQAGFRVAVAIDASKINTAVHKANFPKTTTICGDLRQLDGDQIRELGKLGKAELHVVFGGPPCQGFSVGGKQRVDDPRNELLLEFARLVIELSPKYFVMENVRGLLGDRYTPLLKRFTQRLMRAGYSILTPVAALDAADFGVPQRRKRVFVVGWKKDENAPCYPRASKTRVSVGAAIDDLKLVSRARLADGDSYTGPLPAPTAYSRRLRSPRPGTRRKPITGFARTAHSAEVVQRFRKVRQGGHDPVSRFIRLDREDVAPTLRAGTGAANGRFMAPRPIHPDYPRCITVREAARLHSFPDWFVFHDTKWNGFMQIGNSVPPALASAVASQIMRALHHGKAPKQGNDIKTDGNGRVQRHGGRTEGAHDAAHARVAVSRSKPRPARLTRHRKPI